MEVDAHRVPASATAAGDAKVARAAGNEVARVISVLEADEVRVEKASKEIVADGDGAEDLGGGERRVKEEPDTRAWALVAEEGGVVVVDDDKVAAVQGEHLDDTISELHVHREERSVRTGVEALVTVMAGESGSK
jgi:hypothetical protein